MTSEEKKLILDNELNADGGTEKVLPSVMGLDEFAMVNNANEPEFKYVHPALIGELDKVSAGMVAGLEEISGGELYIDGHRAEEANRPGRVVDSLTSMTAEASDMSSWLL